jgi:hypothetical protein
MIGTTSNCSSLCFLLLTSAQVTSDSTVCRAASDMHKCFAAWNTVTRASGRKLCSEHLRLRIVLLCFCLLLTGLHCGSWPANMPRPILLSRRPFLVDQVAPTWCPGDGQCGFLPVVTVSGLRFTCWKQSLDELCFVVVAEPVNAIQKWHMDIASHSCYTAAAAACNNTEGHMANVRCEMSRQASRDYVT